MLDELAVLAHLADIRVGGLPRDIPLGGGGRGDGQLQVVVRLLHGGDVDALRKGNALRRLHHGDGDGRGEVLAHSGAGGDGGGAHADGVYGAVPIHGGHVLIVALVDHAGAGGVRGGEHGGQLLGGAHGQAESVLVEGQALQRHAVGHMDGHVLIHGAVGIADAHQGTAGGHGGDEAGVADGDNALIQRGIAQVGHQRRLHGRYLRQQLLCHAGVQGDLRFRQGDVGDGGVGERNNIVRARPCREIFCRRIIFSGKSRQIFPTYVLGKPLHHGFLYLKITPHRNSGVDGARILITVTDRYTANAVGVDSSRGVAADIAAVLPQIVAVAVEYAVGVFVIIVQLERAVHKDAAIAGRIDSKHVKALISTQLIEGAVLGKVGHQTAARVDSAYPPAAEVTAIDLLCPVVLAEFTVFGVGDAIIAIVIRQIRIYHIGVIQLDGAPVALVELYTVLGHQLAGEHADVLVLAALTEQSAVHLEIGDGGVGVGVVGIVRPELELGARLHGNGDALLNEGGVGQNVIVIR